MSEKIRRHENLSGANDQRRLQLEEMLQGYVPNEEISQEVQEQLKKRLEETCSELHLSSLRSRNIFELSGGEKQKIAIARALAQEPQVLLFDELTSNLDVKNQADVLSFIKKLTVDKNVITVAIVHDLSLALRFADDIAFMKDGKILRQCPSCDVTAQDFKDTFDVNADVVEINGKKTIIYED